MYPIVSYVMQAVTALTHYISATILNWQDCAEITFFILTSYSILSWLNHDKQKPLVLYAYGYILLIAIAHYCELQSMYNALIFASPVVSLLFIVLHQDVLQKNFIALQKITSKQPKKTGWIEQLVRGMIHACNEHETTVCYIERSHSMAHTFKPKNWINADISSQIIELLSKSIQQNNTPYILWAHDHGKLIAHNPEQTIEKTQYNATQTVEQEKPWIQNALLLTHKTDTLAIACTRCTEPTTTYQCTLIAHGTITKNITTNQLIEVLKKLIHTTEKAREKKYAHQPQKHTTFKQNP